MCSFQCVLLVDSNYTDVMVGLCNKFISYVFFLLMLVTWFLSQKSVFDRQFDGFYLLSLSNCEVLLLHLFLILRLRFFVLKIVSL